MLGPGLLPGGVGTFALPTTCINFSSSAFLASSFSTTSPCAFSDSGKKKNYSLCLKIIDIFIKKYLS